MSFQMWRFSPSVLLSSPRRLLALGMAACIAALIGLAHQQQYVDLASISSVGSPWSSFSGHQVMGQGEPVVFTLIVWGNDTMHETEILLKTTMMYTSSPIDFHLIVDADSQEYLTNAYNLIEKPVYDIRVYFYPISWKAMEERLARTAVGKPGQPRYMELGTKHQSGTPGMMKVLLHEIIPDNVKRSIFVDSDAFFMTDPTLLWQEFNTWGPEVAVSMPAHDSVDMYNGTTKICSCIMLLDLERMRQLRYIDSDLFTPRERARALSTKANLYAYGEPTSKNGVYNNVGLGDQTYFYANKVFMPEAHKDLPLHWEVTSCLMWTYGTGLSGSDLETGEEQVKHQVNLKGTPYEDVPIIPGIVHFNCMFAHTYYESKFFEDPDSYLYKDWLHAVRYHQHFKWLWLNKGKTGATLTIETAKDLRFWDEKRAGKPEAAGY